MSHNAFDLDARVTSPAGPAGEQGPASITSLVTRTVCTRVTCKYTCTCVCTSMCTAGCRKH